jgi:polysaccharide deacetylase family protein (PEP-CTERM system associated)
MADRELAHALSVDVEDWYHDGGVADPREERVEANVERLLELFARRSVRATFFFLGEVAKRFPHLVRRTAESGHEIGSHGHRHRPVSALLSSEFRADVEGSRRLLEDVSGVAVIGYRAPYFSIKAGVRWPIEQLAECGFRYDSSILAIDRPPGLELVSPRAPYRHHNDLVEMPVAILQTFFFWHLPLASGAGLRLLPPRLMQRLVRRFERDVGSGVFYLHPWEIDPGSPTGPGAGRWLLRVGRERLPARLDALLAGRRFDSIAATFGELIH